MTAGQARDAAMLARRQAGLGESGPISDLVRVVEEAGGVLVFALPFGAGSVAGLYERQRDVSFIAVNSDDPPVRQRFTLAHEYGHHRLNHGARLDADIEWSSSDSKERDANEFAAALLMPGQAIELWIEAKGTPEISLDVLVQLAAAYGVSASAAKVRLQVLKRLDEREARRLGDAIAKGEHKESHRRQGLGPYWDTLQANHHQVRLPTKTEQGALELVRAELLSPAVLAARLHLTEDKILEKVRDEREAEGLEV